MLDDMEISSARGNLRINFERGKKGKPCISKGNY